MLNIKSPVKEGPRYPNGMYWMPKMVWARCAVCGNHANMPEGLGICRVCDYV